MGGKTVDLNNERSSDKYAKAILQATYNLDISKSYFEKAVEIFREAERYWTVTDEQSAIKFGVVKKIIHSSTSKPFGFIVCENGEEVFFTCKRNPQLMIKDLSGAKVSFNITLKNGKNRRQAFNIKRVAE